MNYYLTVSLNLHLRILSVLWLQGDTLKATPLQYKSVQSKTSVSLWLAEMGAETQTFQPHIRFLASW